MCFFEDFMTVEQQLADEDVVSGALIGSWLLLVICILKQIPEKSFQTRDDLQVLS
jgi:hypothetical protein